MKIDIEGVDLDVMKLNQESLQNQSFIINMIIWKVKGAN